MGTLTVIATPIGNLGDVSPRTREALSAQDRQDSFHEMMEIALETAWKSID